MSKYEVFGPYRLPVKQKAAGRRIDDNNDFWDKMSNLKERCGCYVFGMSASGSITPYYVGKATKSFKQECFSSHKLGKYNEALADYKKGQPVIFFVAHPVEKGAINKKEIKRVEDFLTQLGLSRNEELLNIKGTKQEQWSISHVIRAKQGQPKKSEKTFKKMMGIEKNSG